MAQSYLYLHIMQTSYPKHKIKILLLENISNTAIEKFTSAGYTQVKRIGGALSEKELIKEIADTHILGIRSKTIITKAVLEAAVKLQAIGCFCIGVNQVDIAAANSKGIAVFNAPYSNTRSVAELVIGAAIMLIRRIPPKDKAAHNGTWLKDATGSYELRGKTIGIIGYGNIGSQVSVLAESLGLKVLYYDAETKMPLGNAVDAKSLKALIEQSDIITLHVPEEAATHNMINRSTLKHCKHGAILINYARGTVADVNAVEVALLDGTLSGAAFDVFPVEPERSGDAFVSPLQNMPNVLLTPHIGGSTQEAQANIGDDVSTKLFNYIESGISYGSHTVPVLNLPLQYGVHRILHIHHNVPGVLGQINTTLSENNINILAQYLKTNDAIGYVVLDVDKKISSTAVDLFRLIKETVKVRVVY